MTVQERLRKLIAEWSKDADQFERLAHHHLTETKNYTAYKDNLDIANASSEEAQGESEGGA